MKLTNDNYYSYEANWEYMSVSQFKRFMECEAAAMAEIRGFYKPPTTTALLVGSYVDSWFEGTLDAFRAEHPEIFKRDGTLKADYVQAERMIQRVRRDELFMEYMSGEKQRIFTGELFGAKWKIKIDSYHPGKRIVDLKTSRSLERIVGQSLVDHYHYDWQGAVYQRVESNGLPVYLAIVTKEDPPDIEICEIEQYDLDDAYNYIGKKMPRVLAVKHGGAKPEYCGVCPYCKSVKTLSAPIPSRYLGFSRAQLETIT